jgi:hypothetical protein
MLLTDRRSLTPPPRLPFSSPTHSDINDPSVSALGADVRGKVGGVAGLVSRLGEVVAYLEAVLTGKVPANNEILYQVQVRCCVVFIETATT